MGVLRRIFSLERLPWNAFVLVTCYWLLAFGIAYMVELCRMDGAWWNIKLFSTPGRMVGVIVFELCEVLLKVNYGHLLGEGLWKFQLALLLTALIVGGVVYLLGKGAVCLLKTKKG